MTFAIASRASKIKAYASFSGATFTVDVDFSDVNFGNVDFSNADFQGEFELNGAIATGDACFFDARFADLTSFWQFKLPYGKAIFTSSRFDDKVILDATYFKEIDFSPRGDLSSCDIDDKTVFPPSAFFDQVNFRNSKIGKANFQESYFTDLNLSGSTFETLLFTDTLYNRLFYNGSTTNFYRALQKGFDFSGSTDKQKYDALDKLRSNFKGFGQLSLTNKAHYEKSVLERLYDTDTETTRKRPELKPFDLRTWWNFFKFSVSLGSSYFLEWTSGFLVEPWRAFGASCTFIVAFGFIYFLIDTISSLAGNKKTVVQSTAPWRTITDRFEVSQQFNSEPIKENRETFSVIKLLNQKFWNALLFSTAKFVRIKFDKTPDSRVYWLENLEWIIGKFMLASLVLSIANSVPGLERIVGAILPG